jgi:hypothetical protein
MHSADGILPWLAMDLRPNRRLTFHEFFTDDDEEALDHEEVLVQDEADDATVHDQDDFIDGSINEDNHDDDPLNDSLPTIPEHGLVDVENALNLTLSDDADEEVVEDDDFEINDLEENQLILRASCPQCERILVEADQIFLLIKCGHLQCGTCSEEFSGVFCVFCGEMEEKIEMKL